MIVFKLTVDLKKKKKHPLATHHNVTGASVDISSAT